MLKVETESFRLTNALFRDNILFIYFKTTEEIGQIFKKLRNLYIRYKIVAFNQEHSEFELIKKSAVNLTRSYLVAELELDQVQSIEETKIIILSVSFHLQDGRNLIFPIFHRVSLINICTNDIDIRPEFYNKKEVEEQGSTQKSYKKKSLKPKFEAFNGNPALPIKKEELEKSHNQDFNKINEKIEKSLELGLKKIESNQLIFQCLNLLLSNLLVSHEEERDYKVSPIIRAIQKYIEIDLIKDMSDDP